MGRGGAFVAIRETQDLVPKSNIRLTFQLPDGQKVSTVAVVRWRREKPTIEGPPGCGVLFMGMGRAETEVVERYLKACAAQSSPLPAPSVGSDKSTVEVSQWGWVVIRLQGMLSKEQSNTLAHAVESAAGTRRDGRLLVLVDATHFRPCNDDGLPGLQKWLAFLGGQPSFGGVLVGRSTVGMLQLRRIAREENVAGSWASFEDEDAAIEFLRTAQEGDS